MALTQHTLPIIENLPVGTVKPYLWYDDAITDLVLPTFNTFKSTTPFRESADWKTGEVEIDNVDVEVVEDYTTHTEGFWNKLFHSTVTGGTTEKSFFIIDAASTPADLGAEYFTLSSTTVNYYVWFDLDNLSTPPTPGGTGIEVNIATGDTIEQMIDKLVVVLDGHAAFSAYKSWWGCCRMEAVVPGDTTDIGIGSFATEVSVGTFEQGSTPTDYTDVQIMFTVMEDANETFLFRGNLYRGNISETEYYLNSLSGTPTIVSRGVKFKLVTNLNVLKNTTCASLCAEALTHEVVGTIDSGVTTYNMLTFKSILATAIQLAYGESYDEALVIIDSTDIQAYNTDSSAWETPINLYIPGGLLRTAGEISGTASAQYLYRFSTAFDVVKHICSQFALIPRYSFGDANELIDATPANNKSRLVLGSRGRSGATVTFPVQFSSSEKVLEVSRKSTDMYIAEVFTASNGIYYQNGVRCSGAPPSYIQFSIVKKVDHELENTSDPGGFSWGMVYTYDGVSDFSHVVTARYWNYQTGAYVEVQEIHPGYGFAGALADYYYNRFSGGDSQYTRLYHTIQAIDTDDTSQRWMRSMIRHTIHDGIASKTYYAIEIEKDITKGQTKIIWAEE